VAAVPVERLDTLLLGMNQEAVIGLLGAPHGRLKPGDDADEILQYVVRDDRGNRAFIASLWFGNRGLWLASGRSRAVGQLSAIKFDTAPLGAASDQRAQVVGAPAPAAPASATVPTPKEMATPSTPAVAASIAPAAPVPTATVAASPDGVVDRDRAAALRAALDAWLKDWSKQDVAAYLAHYASTFSAVGKSRIAWERERRQRLSQSAFIRVSAANVRGEDGGSAHPRLVFEQSYESDSYQEKSRKVLTFVQEDGRWLIEKEQSSALPRR
jgi:hypothetical protein